MTEPSLYDLPTLYDLIVRVGPCETFYRELARHTGGPILDLACGTGRITVPLAREGHRVVGLDVSPAMLRKAQVKAGCLEVQFVQGDMRDFDLKQRFPLIIVSCNSLAHLTTNADLQKALSAVRKHLTRKGVFAFDIINPNVQNLSRLPSECMRLDVGPNPSSAIAVEEIATYDAVRQIRAARWRILHPDSTTNEIAPLHLRLLFPQELILLLQGVGLQLVERYGDFARSPLTTDSLNQVCLARLAPRQRARVRIRRSIAGPTPPA
jgi:SAM-dependent methyltransferase